MIVCSLLITLPKTVVSTATDRFFFFTHFFLPFFTPATTVTGQTLCCAFRVPASSRTIENHASRYGKRRDRDRSIGKTGEVNRGFRDRFGRSRDLRQGTRSRFSWGRTKGCRIFTAKRLVVIVEIKREEYGRLWNVRERSNWGSGRCSCDLIR